MKYPSYYDANRIFLRNLAIRDIAEPLPSFDQNTPAEMARSALNAARLTVAGVRQAGWVCGYLLFEELGSGICADYLHPLNEAKILADSAPLIELLRVMKDTPWVLMRSLGVISGIVTRADLQDPPVRMWLFGTITVIELHFKKMIEEQFQEEEWSQYLSPARFEKAVQMRSERQRRNENPTLLECLQFSDKGQIIARDQQLREKAGFASRRRADEAIKRLQMLRNNLAHSQDIIETDWEIIATIADNLQRLFDLGYFSSER